MSVTKLKLHFSPNKWPLTSKLLSANPVMSESSYDPKFLKRERARERKKKNGSIKKNDAAMNSLLVNYIFT